MKHIRIGIAFLLAALAVPAFSQNRTYFAGHWNAGGYAYGIQSGSAALVIDAPALSAAGVSTTYTVAYGSTTTGDGTTFNPLNTNAPVQVCDSAGCDTATPSAVSCSTPAILDSCTFTATFTNAHGKGSRVSSGTIGLQESINAASSSGGGTVVTDSSWFNTLGGTKTIITGIVSTTPKVWILDLSGVAPVYYGKSNATTGAYSAVNNDTSFVLTTTAGTVTKTLSQTYAVAPSCVGTYTGGTHTGILSLGPTTTTVVITDSVSEAAQVTVSCNLQK